MEFTNIDMIPAILKKNGKFCGWRFEERRGKPAKIPYNLMTGRHAKTNDIASFVRFSDAVKLTACHSYDGLGILVADNIVAIDIDHCLKKGQISKPARDIVASLRSYTEISPSGEGLRIFGLVQDYIYDKDKYFIKNGHLEIYVAGATNRFVTITGHVWCDYPVADLTHVLPAVCDRYMSRPAKQINQKEHMHTRSEITLCDQEIIRMAEQYNPQFSKLWGGNTEKFLSHSEADLALCLLLAYWTGKDPEQIDRLFRMSGLYRDKWEREDYRMRTINAAINKCDNTYDDVKSNESTHQDLAPGISESNIPVLTCLEDIQDQEVQWLVPCRIPQSELTLICGDGGVGKTSIICDIAAAVTRGIPSFMESDMTPMTSVKRIPGRVLFFSSEDDFGKILKKRLKNHGADLSRINTIETKDERFQELKFDSLLLKDIIAYYRPTLCIFDPLQAFIPKEINMASRNAMRDVVNHLVQLAHEYGTTFIVIMHSNKKTTVAGRGRFADSADIFDLARSAFMVGHADNDDVFYCSHEKSNYGKLSPTLLYTISDDTIIYRGTSEKRDYDFTLENRQRKIDSPKRDEAKDIIIRVLTDADSHCLPAKELESLLIKGYDVSLGTLNRAKSELKEEGVIQYRRKGYGTQSHVFVHLVDQDDIGDSD